MSHISSPHLVRCADGDAVASLWAEISLLLDDDYDAITHFCRPFGSQNIDALDNGGARVVDAIDEGLELNHGDCPVYLGLS